MPHRAQASSDAAAALKSAAASGDGGDGGSSGGSVHVFTALQYLRKLCSHPELVLDLSHPVHKAAVAKALGGAAAGDGAAAAAQLRGALRDPACAPKLLALRELLVQCGVVAGEEEEGGGGRGGGGGEGEELEGGGGGGGHRLLVFAQVIRL